MTQVFPTIKLIISFMLLVYMMPTAYAQIDFEFDQILDTGLRSSSIATGDFNSDGNPDLVVANIFSHNFTIYLNDGAGQFTESVEVPLQDDLLHPIAVAAGDLDGDGNIDLAAAQFQSLGGSNIIPLSDASILFLYNNGDLTFEQHKQNIIGIPSRVKIFDLDQDGMNDVIVSNNGEISFDQGTGSIGQFDGGIYPYMNSGNRVFVAGTPATDFDDVGSVVDFVPMDYNNDGRIDIIGVDQGKPVVNEFLQFEFIDIGYNFFRNTVSGLGVEKLEDLNYQPWSIDQADFDGDGDNDIVISIVGEVRDLTSFTGNNASIRIIANNNNGNFSELATINTTGVVFAVEANDYDMDGDIDIIATIQEIQPVGQSSVLLVPSLRFYENDGNNEFTEVLSFSIEEEPRYSVVADFDGDGDLDIAVLCTIRDTDRASNAIEGRVYIYKNLAINESSVHAWNVY